MEPSSLKGKEFETLVIDAAKRQESRGTLTLSRYGVQGVTFGGKTILVPSLPDLEGVLAPSGRQFIIECKVVSGSSLPLADDHFRQRQFAHLEKRARFGAACFVLIHFNGRKLATKLDSAMTVAVPVSPLMSFWDNYMSGAIRSLSRAEAVAIGYKVPWEAPPRCRKFLPDLLSFLAPEKSLANQLNLL